MGVFYDLGRFVLKYFSGWYRLVAALILPFEKAYGQALFLLTDESHYSFFTFSILVVPAAQIGYPAVMMIKSPLATLPV